MISYKEFKNQKLLSKRTPAEKRALHSQFRQLNKTDDAADNSNPRPWTKEDYENIEKWVKSREKDTAFKGVVDRAKYDLAVYKQHQSNRSNK